MLVDGDTQAKAPAFDHAKLAAALSTALGRKITAARTAVQRVHLRRRTCGASSSSSRRGPGGAGAGAGRPTRRRPGAARSTRTPARRSTRGGRGAAADAAAAGWRVRCGRVRHQRRRAEEVARRQVRSAGQQLQRRRSARPASREVTLLSTDGSEGGYYDPDSLVWSPDSKKLAVYKVKPGYRRYVHYVESSPEDQLQPKHSTLQYAKPGDVLDVETPGALPRRHAGSRSSSTTRFPERLRRDAASSGARTAARSPSSTTSAAIRSIASSRSTPRPGTAARRHHRGAEDLLLLLRQEVPARSRRRQGNHLDVGARRLEPPLPVRRRHRRGEEPDHQGRVGRPQRRAASTRTSAQIWFSASGMYPGKDPYFVHYYRINFDGTGLTAADPGRRQSHRRRSRRREATTSTPTRASTWRRSPSCAATRTASLVAEAREGRHHRADEGRLEAAGSVRRQGPRRQDRHLGRHRPADELRSGEEVSGHREHLRRPAGLVRAEVVRRLQRDAGAGRARLHRRADRRHGHEQPLEGVPRRRWKNLEDAGFPDRILWHKAAAAKYPYYDITRVGIYGTSAGGQNALGGLLFLPEFYKVAVSAAGCHDNRMDKIWWNEQWMGWPIGREYAESSNVDNAYRLQGKLLLIVGELDQNVDPASTYPGRQPADQAQQGLRAARHPRRGPRQRRRLRRSQALRLLHAAPARRQTPPEWKTLEDATKKTTPPTTALR